LSKSFQISGINEIGAVNLQGISTSPDGETFLLPQSKDYVQEQYRLQKLAHEHRLLRHEIVVVIGVGFVGAVMSGVVADAVDKSSGKPRYYVI
jgi:UDP-N-acetyl-D-glucosamine dehydrogenase